MDRIITIYLNYGYGHVKVINLDFTDLDEPGWEPWMTAEKDRHRHHRQWKRYEQLRGKRRNKISDMGRGRCYGNR